MDDEEFERLLAASGATGAVPQPMLDAVVEGARPVVRRRRRRRALVAGGVLAAGLAVAAAATSDRWMHQEPFASFDDGMYRVQQPITVRWTMADGERDACRAFLEYSDLSTARAERADAWARAHAADYAALGQRLVDDARASGGRYEAAEQAVFDGLDPVLHAAAEAALPEALPQGTDSATAARVSGYAIRCERQR